MKKYEGNKTDLIIKIGSYILAVVIVVYSVLNYDSIDYNSLFITIGKIGLCSLGVAILIAVIVWFIKKKKEDNDE